MITSYLSETSKQYMAHVLGLVKSYWPAADLAPLSDRLAAGCSEEQFAQYVEDLKPVGDKIVESLEHPAEDDA